MWKFKLIPPEFCSVRNARWIDTSFISLVCLCVNWNYRSHLFCKAEVYHQVAATALRLSSWHSDDATRLVSIGLLFLTSSLTKITLTTRFSNTATYFLGTSSPTVLRTTTYLNELVELQIALWLDVSSRWKLKANGAIISTVL